MKNILVSFIVVLSTIVFSGCSTTQKSVEYSGYIVPQAEMVEIKLLEGFYVDSKNSQRLNFESTDGSCKYNGKTRYNSLNNRVEVQVTLSSCKKGNATYIAKDINGYITDTKEKGLKTVIKDNKPYLEIQKSYLVITSAAYRKVDNLMH